MMFRNYLKISLVALLFTVVQTVSLYAGPYEEYQAAFNREDYALALQIIRPLAEKGNPAAQYALGSMYSLGQGVSRDEGKAIKW
jgi:TPR repeat protein